MRSVAFLLASVASAFAYQVLVPNGVQGWTNVGSQPLTWERVDTDRLNFTAVLINQSIQGFSPQVLAALVNGTLGEARMNPPSGGWPMGSHFRINLVQDTNNNTILAQSPEFNITLPTSSTNGSSTLVASNTNSPLTIPTTSSDSGSGTTILNPVSSSPSAGVSNLVVPTSLLGFFSLMAIILT